MHKDFRCWIVETKRKDGTQIGDQVFFDFNEADAQGKACATDNENVIGYEVHELKRAGKKRGTK